MIEDSYSSEPPSARSEISLLGKRTHLSSGLINHFLRVLGVRSRPEQLVMDRPKVLFTSPVMQYPPYGGPALRIANTIKVLSEVSDLTIAYTGGCSDFSSETAAFLGKHSGKILFPFGKPQARGRIARLLQRFRLTNRRDNPDVMSQQRIADVVVSGDYDLIWLGYGNISYPLLKLIKKRTSVPVVLDTDSVWSRYILRGLPFAKDDTERQRIEGEGKEKEEEEAWGTELADLTTAVSEVDAEYYRQFVDSPRRIHIFSNVIDLSDYEKIPLPPVGHVRENIYLAGTFWSGSPMEHAARWTINEVLPIVRMTHPGVHLYIVGKDSDKVLADVRDASITVAGRVDSVLPYLCHTRVALVPLWFESGTRFKILEAGACRVPVVSTTLGAEGIPVEHGKDILIADTPESFATEIVRFLEHPDFARATADSLGTLVAKNYALQKLKVEAEAILSDVLLPLFVPDCKGLR